MTKTLFILLGMIIISSCNNSKTPNAADDKVVKSIGLPYLIDVEQNLGATKSVPLSSIGKNLEYIPLETNPKYMIEKIQNIGFSEDFIFIADYSKILQFDRKGNFLRQIGAEGRGPGEFYGITGFCVDPKNKTLLVNSYNGRKILEFDFNGLHIRSFDLPWRSYQFIVYDTTGLIFHFTNDNDSTVYSKYNFYITDHELTPIYKIKRNFIRKSNIAAREIPLYYFKNIMHFKQYTVDTLFTLENETPKPYAIFKLGKSKLNPNIMFDGRNQNVAQMVKEIENYFEISKIIETDNYLFTNLAFGVADSSKHCIFNKQSAETIIIEDEGLSNDIDGGIRFWPKQITDDNLLVDYVDAFDLLKKTIPANLRSRISETSNPVLMILK